MRIKLNIILAVLGVSFFVPISNAQTWYDSEGRELSFDGKKVVRKVVDKISEKVEPEKEVVSQIIPKVLELRPELSSAPCPRIYQNYYPYSHRAYGSYCSYGSYGMYGRSNYNYRSPRYQGYYGYGGFRRNYSGGYPRTNYGTNFYLNYQRGGLRVQTRF